jgi:hypothetical protein
MTLSDLIQRLAEATEGSRELDEAIALQCGWVRKDVKHDFKWLAPNGQLFLIAPHFTASLDDAYSLVPEGCAWNVGCEIDLTPTATVFGHDVHANEFAPTPALALCIAALKSQASLRARLTEAEKS